MHRRHFLRATAGIALVSGCLRLQEQGGNPDDGVAADDGSADENVVTIDDAGDESWPMQRFDPANTAYNPDGTVPRDVPEVRGRIDRSASTPADGLLADGAAYFATDGTVTAIDPETGDQQWSEGTEDQPLLPEAIATENDSGARARDGTVYGIDREDGSVAVEFPFGGSGLGLTPAGDVWIAPAFDGWVRGVSPPAQEVRWETPVGGAAMPAAVHGETVFLSVIRNEETDPDVVNLEEPDEIDAGGFLNVLNASDGEMVGQRERERFAIAPPAVRDDLLYWAGFDGEVIVIDLAGPEEAWRFEADDGIYRSPALADGIAVVGTEAGTVYGIDTGSGDEEWSFSTGGRVRGGPIGVGNVVFAGSDDGSMYALDVRTGDLLWQFEAEAPVRSLTAGNDRVHVGTRSAIYTLGQDG